MATETEATETKSLLQQLRERKTTAVKATWDKYRAILTREAQGKLQPNDAEELASVAAELQLGDKQVEHHLGRTSEYVGIRARLQPLADHVEAKSTRLATLESKLKAAADALEEAKREPEAAWKSAAEAVRLARHELEQAEQAVIELGRAKGEYDKAFGDGKV